MNDMSSNNEDIEDPFALPDEDSGPMKSSHKSSHVVKKDHVVLNGRAKIYFEKPFSKYNRNAIKAYHARTTGSDGQDCFALISSRGMLPRFRQAEIYSQIINPCLARLVDRGVVYWPPAKKEMYVFVYEDSLDKPLVESEENVALGLNAEMVRNVIMPTIASALTDFRDKDFFHGGLRISNMYARIVDDNLSGVVVGDVLTEAYGFSQPALYMTVPQALADPVARGRGSNAEDIYAFGVCLALMLRTNDPLKGKSDDEIIQEKISHGSYQALTGKERFTGAALELLRGVLQDNEAQRWTIDDINTWLEGRRLSPKQGGRSKVAPRALVFSGRKYVQSEVLAMELSHNVSEAVHMIDNGEIYQWALRSLEDKNISQNLEDAVSKSSVGGKGKDYDHRLVTNTCIALYPNAPIFYKALALHPEGIGRFLFSTMHHKADIKPVVEIFNAGIDLNWLSAQTGGSLDIGALVNIFDRTRKALKNSKIGYGAERACYTLNPNGYCMSAELEDYYVFDPKDLLLAMEKKAETGKEIKSFLDRHIVAFLSKKDPKVIDNYLYDLASSLAHKTAMATLLTYASIQDRYKVKSVPNLAESIMRIATPVLERYHDRKKREKIQEGLRAAVNAGNIYEMAVILNDAKNYQDDKKGFRKAFEEYQKLVVEYEEIRMNLIDRKSFGKNLGREISAVISSVIAGIIILLTTLKFFVG